MTNAEINIAIAEACGLNVVQCPFIPNRVHLGPTTCFATEALAQWKKTYPGGGNVKSLPDYCHDLNAMHEAEEILKRDNNEYYQQGGFGTYIVTLRRGPAFAPECASALERAEAFLRTIGKWKD